MKNQFSITHAFPGICSLCGTEVAEFNGSHPNGKPIIKRFLPNYYGLQLILGDDSVMNVTLCNNCGPNLDKKDYKKLMKSECDGWQWELDHCLKWTKKQKDDYKKNYFKKTIKDHEKPTKEKHK